MSDVPDSIVDSRDAVIQQQADLLAELREKVKRLQALLESKADAKAAKKPVFTENYSLDRNKRRKKKP